MESTGESNRSCRLMAIYQAAEAGKEGTLARCGRAVIGLPRTAISGVSAGAGFKG